MPVSYSILLCLLDKNTKIKSQKYYNKYKTLMMLFCKKGNILHYCSAILLERKLKHPKPIIILISLY